MKHTDEGWILEKEEIVSVNELKKRLDLIDDSFTLPSLDFYHVYYFDSEKGNDDNDGLTESHPKKTLNEANALIKNVAKLALLFKKGCKFEGNLIIEDSLSSDASPLYISSYGMANRYPLLVGRQSIVRICDSNIIIDGLEIAGEDALRGIHITPKKPGILENIFIINNYVHDINWHYKGQVDPAFVSPEELNVEEICPEMVGNGLREGPYFYRYHGGIIAHNEVGPSCFRNIHIKNNIVKNVARTGITLYNKWTNKPGVGYGYNKFMGYDSPNNFETGEGYFESSNIFCCGNYLECAGGDAIVISSAKNVIVKNNISYFANYLGRKQYWNASIWVYNVDCCLFSENEAGFTYKCFGSEDAQGFDLDNCCQNVLFIDNISHHNQGGGLLICNLATPFDKSGKKETGRWFNNFVIHNYFYQNGKRDDNTRSAFLTIARETDYASFLNNIVVVDNTIDGQSIIHTEDESTYCYKLLFQDNLFLSAEKSNAILRMKMMRDSSFVGNRFKNVKEFGDNPVEAKGYQMDMIDFKIEGKTVFERRLKAFDKKTNFQKTLGRVLAYEI